jgi:hypothetical protein
MKLSTVQKKQLREEGFEFEIIIAHEGDAILMYQAVGANYTTVLRSLQRAKKQFEKKLKKLSTLEHSEARNNSKIIQMSIDKDYKPEVEVTK